MAEATRSGSSGSMEAKARGATVIHVDPRFTRTSARSPTSTCRCGPAATSPSSAALVNHVLEQRAVVPRLRPRLHQRARSSSARTSATPRTSTGCSPASTRRRGSYDPRPGSTPGIDVRQPTEHGARRADTTKYEQEPARAPVGSGGAALDPGEPHQRRDAAAPALRLPGAQAALRPLHAARWSRRSAACRRSCSRRSPTRSSPQLRPRPHDGVRLRVGWTQHTRRRRSTSAPPRSCSCCSATSAGPAAASWRCAATRQHPGLDRHPDAVQPAARLHPDAARAAARATSTSTSTLNTPRRRLLGQHARVHRQPAQGLVGRRRDCRATTSASTTCRGSPATTRTYPTVMTRSTASARATS